MPPRRPPPAAWRRSRGPSTGLARTARERCATEPCRNDVVEVAQGFVREQTSKVEFQQALIISHPDRSHAVGWPMMQRPVLFYFENCEPPADCSTTPRSTKRVVGIGNLAVWGASIVSIGVVVVGVIPRRRWASVDPLVLIAAQWLPWMLSPNPGFFFYMTPVVPFMAMCVGVAVSSIGRRSVQWWTTLAVAGAACAVFAFYRPVWFGLPMTPADVEARLFLESWR